MLAGGYQNKNVNFEIPCNSDEKPIELHPSNNRREYRRRAAVLESMRTQIHSLAQGNIQTSANIRLNLDQLFAIPNPALQLFAPIG